MGQYNIILPDTLHKRFKKKAREKHGSGSRVVIRLIKKWLKGEVKLEE